MKLRQFLVLTLAGVLTATLAGQATAAAETPQRLKPQTEKLVRGKDSTTRAALPPATGKPYKPKAPVWPAGSADLETASGRAVKAGSLPVKLHGSGGKAKVEVLDRAATAKAKVPGVLVRVSGKGKNQVSVDYSGFATAYGADWGARLGLVALPECALSTPDDSACSGEPVAATNDVAAKTVTADVDLAAQSLFAVAAAPSGAAGDFGATSLQPSSTWSAGGNAGGFGWAYPMRTPPVAGGLAPQVSLSYSSQSVDGRMAASNNQPSWIGEGFEYAPGFIERKYKKCTGTGDLCWATDNAVLSLNGSSTELIYEEGKGWHGRAEDGSRIERHTGAVNGDDNGEYWVVTASNGTQYWFGRSAASAWNVPVFNGASAAQQTWRWNLDYVVDVNGNTMSLTWQTETNKYAKGGNANDLATYVRGGWLSRIDYGNGSAHVALDVADRCLGTNCGTHDAANWPDTPWDQECNAAPCYVGSPTFWTTKRLSKVTTRLSNGDGSHRDIESWILHHTFPDPGDGTRAGLWLDRIQHTGHAAGDTAVPDVRFTGQQLQNRVDTIDHSAPMNWFRISRITNESGGSVNVTYSAPECVAGSNMPANPESNTMRCYPVRWTPPGYTSPITDWFHKYVVTAVSELDGPAAGVRKLTRYDYVGTPAWHYTDEDGIIDADAKTWSVWRGYDTVRTIAGEPQEESVTQTKYFRGMHGDKLPSGMRSVQLPAAGGASAVDDEDAWAGMVRESILFNGATEVSGEVTVPWASAPTATRTVDGQIAYARFTGVAARLSRTTLDDGRAPRTSSVHNTFDAYGMVVKVEEAIPGDPRCVLTDYARNTSAWILNTPSRVRSFALPCATAEAGGTLTEDDIIGDVRTYYDDATVHGAAPVKGLVTKVENLAALGSYQTVSTSKYDGYGRVVESTDLRGNKTTTAYTHNAGGQVTEVKTTNHLGWESRTVVEPAYGSPTSTVDPNGRVTDLAYDGLGRLTSVWLPGRRKGTDSASSVYEYLVRDNAPTVVTTKKLLPTGNTYAVSNAIYDGLLRPRQTQSPEAATTGNRIITDTHYDSAGRAFKVNGPYVAAGAITTDFFTAYADYEIEISNLTRFDGAGRPVAQIFQPTGVERWRTSTVYGGDRIDVTPPAGGTPTSTVTDVRGRTVEVRQHNGAGGYDTSRYAYDRKGQQSEVIDAMGNKWTYDYDLLGRQTSATDPDKGTTTSAYNAFNELVSTTDARGTTVAYAYDTLGRKISVHDGNTAGPKRAEWTYDTLAKGQLTKSTRYDGANAYIVEASGFDAGYRPTGSKITIPAAETGLAGTYTYTSTYRADGSPATTKLPALTGLAAETLYYGYNHLGLPTTVQTDLGSLDGDPVWLVDGTGYTSFGELSTLGRSYNGGKWIDVGYIVDSRTRRVTETTVGRGTTPATVANIKYSYDDAGNILSQKHTAPGAVVDTQCYTYDYLRRLTEAWTPASQECTGGPSAVGGPAPYWQTWTFDQTGNRQTQVDHGTATGDRTTTYTYPAAGAVRPHAVTGTSTVDTAGTVTASYTYDNAGNTLNRNGKTLTWDSEGHLATNDASSYLYDADGNRLIARDATGKTLYLPGQELRYTTSGGAKAGTRYYSHAGQTVAMRKGSTLTWLVNDHQGTAITTVLESTQAITVRRQLPYGGARGATVTWPNDKGFVGGTKDPTGLTHLGAREYDPDLGRFISVDPVMDLADPQQWNAYSYANGSPITKSDPSGLRPVSGESAIDDSHNGIDWSIGAKGKYTPVYAKPSVADAVKSIQDHGSWLPDPAQPVTLAQFYELSQMWTDTRGTVRCSASCSISDVSQEELRSYVATYMCTYFEKCDLQDAISRESRRTFAEWMSWVPVVGVPYSIALANEDRQNGAYVSAALNVAGVLPPLKAGKITSFFGNVRFTADQSTVAQRIAGGHSYDKHVVKEGQFPGVHSKGELAEVVQTVMLRGETRPLERGRVGFWLNGVLVVFDPKSKDYGTIFVPRDGRAKFDSLQ